MRVRTRGARAALLAVVLLLSSTPAVSAHGDLVDAGPGPGDEVATGSTVVELEFDDLDTSAPASVTIVDAAGDPVAVGDAAIVSERFVCARTAPLAEGVHTLEYAVVGAGGEPRRSRYQFLVDPAAPAASTRVCDTVDLAEPVSTSGSGVTGRGGSGGPMLWVLAGVVVLAALVSALAVGRRRAATTDG